MRLSPDWLGSFLIVRMTAPLTSLTVIVTNTDELSRGVPQLTTETQYRAALSVFLGAKATPALLDAIVAQYPESQYGSYTKAYVQVISQATIICASFSISSRPSPALARAGSPQ